MKELSTEKSWENQNSGATDYLRQMISINDLEIQDYGFGMAIQAKDYIMALKLVQDIYRKEGYLNSKEKSATCRILKNHFYDKTAVFIGKKQGEIAFTVSLFPDASWGLPMDSIYKEELDQLRFQGRKIGEVGCLATHPDHRHISQTILMHGFKMMFKHASENLGLDDLVITVHPKHALVYKEILMFEEVCPGTVKTYPTVNNNPAFALRLNLHEVEAKLKHYYNDNPPETNLYQFMFQKEPAKSNPLRNKTIETISYGKDSQIH